ESVRGFGDAGALPRCQQVGGARVDRLNRRVERHTGSVKQVEAIAVSGTADRGYLFAAYICLSQHVTDGIRYRPPQRLNVALGITGRAVERVGTAAGGGDFLARRADQRDLRDGVAAIHT